MTSILFIWFERFRFSAQLHFMVGNTESSSWRSSRGGAANPWNNHWSGCSDRLLLMISSRFLSRFTWTDGHASVSVGSTRGDWGVCTWGVGPWSAACGHPWDRRPCSTFWLWLLRDWRLSCWHLRCWSRRVTWKYGEWRCVSWSRCWTRVKSRWTGKWHSTERRWKSGHCSKRKEERGSGIESSLSR